MRRPLWLCLAMGALVAAAASSAQAHDVTVDGNAVDWYARGFPADNLAAVAREAGAQGELIWRDTVGDTRTDLATPETVADISEVHFTGTATHLHVLVRLEGGAPVPGPVQVQVAIDMDRVAGSGQNFFAAFADTQVHDDARWEYLVHTQLGSGGPGVVLDTAFAEVGQIVSAQGGDGIEMSIPWTALGLAGPPPSALRFTVATFRTGVDDLTLPIGDGTVSNALDAVTHYGDPASAAYPNTFVEVSDQIVDHYLDAHFDAMGEVYSPLLITHFVSSSSPVTSSGEWIILRNVSMDPIALGGFKLGDSTTPDAAGEGMLMFPAGATVAAQANFEIAESAAAYLGAFGTSPDAEIGSTEPAVEDMSPPFANWGGAAMGLDDAGDEIMVLDASSTILDAVSYGTGSLFGVTPIAATPGADIVVLRDPEDGDTDSGSDFVLEGVACFDDVTCGGDCDGCTETHVCRPKMPGDACADADLCNGDETCDGGGNCVAGSPPDCTLTGDCAIGSCDAALGCVVDDVVAGTTCDDGNPDNGPDICDGMGSCVPEGGTGGSGGGGAGATGGSATGGAGTGTGTGSGTGASNNNLANDQEQVGITDEGCGCRVGPVAPVRWAWLVVAPIAFALRRRRRDRI